MHRLFLLLVPFLLTGCAAIPLATLGTVAGLTATAVTTGADVYSRGKLDSAELAPLELVHDAVHVSASEMGFTFVREQSSPGEFTFRYRDEHDALTKITLESRTPRLTRIRINVGASGSEPTARLMLKRIRAYLAEPPLFEPVPQIEYEKGLPAFRLNAANSFPHRARRPAAFVKPLRGGATEGPAGAKRRHPA